MSSVDKAGIVSALTNTVFTLARAGIRHRYPEASPREQFLRLAIVTLGADLLRKAYPDIASIDQLTTPVDPIAIAVSVSRVDDLLTPAPSEA